MPSFPNRMNTVPCGRCGRPTTSTGTKRCDACWELETRIQADPAMARAILAELSPITDEPIPMVLHCPKCHVQHIDAPDENPCGDGCQYSKDIGMWPEHSCGDKCMYMQPGSPRWTNPPHKTHLCNGCGHLWRPANVPTTGVVALPPKGP